MKEAVRRKALELGFDACRFAAAAPPDHAAEFQRWLAEGSHAGMEWMSRNADKRVDPQLVLPGARTVVLLAASYGSSDPAKNKNTPPPSDQAGVVARYARGPDYHNVLRDPLRALAAWMDEQGRPGRPSLWYVDTGPVLERDLAQRAGLGFAGKHTNLISHDLGNWFLLAEILTTLEIQPDPPARNRCGACVKCIDACPTGAIRAPFQLDARRCVSYLTIELRGAIPEELREGIGNRIFGCDDCLAVCPWNRFAREGRLLRDHAGAVPATLDLRGLLRLDEPAFKARFGATPLARPKRRGLLRNVCVALGNVGSIEDLEDLEKARNGGDPLVAEHAAWAIGRIGRRARGPA